MKNYFRVALVALALLMSGCSKSPTAPSGNGGTPSPTPTPTPAPPPGTVTLSHVFSANMGRYLVSGDTVYYPDDITISGGWSVANRTASRYDVIVSFAIDGIFGGIPPKFAPSNGSPLSMTETTWSYSRTVIGPPFLSVNGGSPSFFDRTDDLVVALAANPSGGLFIVPPVNIPFVLHYAEKNAEKQ